MGALGMQPHTFPHYEEPEENCYDRRCEFHEPNVSKEQRSDAAPPGHEQNESIGEQLPHRRSGCRHGVQELTVPSNEVGHKGSRASGQNCKARR